MVRRKNTDLRRITSNRLKHGIHMLHLMNGAEMDVGIVVIGRNEGERLQRCMESLQGLSILKVYVDSGSTDGSVPLAQSHGCEVVQLNTELPFTAARARNAGASRLLQMSPGIEYIQFIDGDCVLDKAWVPGAISELEQDRKIAIVCGRRRELSPGSSVYNLLCDMEWDTPIGKADACGGDFLIRASAFSSVNGFNGAVIAGEEPELCHRLKSAGWEVIRIDREMTLHDAAMKKFSQYWQRAKRSGHAYAQSCFMYWNSGAKFQVRPMLSIVFWACFLPLLIASVSVVSSLLGLIVVMLYPALWLKMLLSRRSAYGDDLGSAAKYSFFILIAKWPQLIGVLEFASTCIQKRTPTIIEYK